MIAPMERTVWHSPEAEASRTAIADLDDDTQCILQAGWGALLDGIFHGTFDGMTPAGIVDELDARVPGTAAALDALDRKTNDILFQWGYAPDGIPEDAVMENGVEGVKI
jgi:hypothetical protein